MRAVLDTNVFVSGIFWSKNFCGQVIGAWRNGGFELVSSFALIEELTRVLGSFKIKMEKSMILEWEKVIIENAVLIEPETKVRVVEEDPDDDKFIWAAMDSGAKFIVSQDNHLLKISGYAGIKIIKPEEFLEIIKQKA